MRRTSALAPLGATLFSGLISEGNPNECQAGSDACPLGCCGDDIGDGTAPSGRVYHRLRNATKFTEVPIGQELAGIPFFS